MALNFVTFNQDYSQIAIGTSEGFRIYKTDPFTKWYETHEGNVSRLEMLFSTPLVALVMSPRRLVITNTKRNSTICELTYPNTILSIRLNRKRLVTVQEDQINIYDISNMKLIHTINTSPNPHGICALAPTSDHCYLAYPHPQRPSTSSFAPPSHIPPTSPHHGQQTGHVLIFDAINLQAVNVIEAHLTPLSCIVMNGDGTRLATASDKGTIIRVFSVPGAQKLFQFRRGSMPARILSMSFNLTSTLLCVSSDSDTIHIFRLLSPEEQIKNSPVEQKRLSNSQRSSGSAMSNEVDEDDEDEGGVSPGSDITNRKHNGTFAGMIRRTSQTVGKSFAATVGGYLPSAVTEMLEPARDFAWIKIPKTTNASNLKSLVALSSNSPQVMVVTSEGNFYVFNLDLETGGEGTMIRQHSLLESADRPRARRSLSTRSDE